MFVCNPGQRDTGRSMAGGRPRETLHAGSWGATRSFNVLSEVTEYADPLVAAAGKQLVQPDNPVGSAQ